MEHLENLITPLHIHFSTASSPSSILDQDPSLQDPDFILWDQDLDLQDLNPSLLVSKTLNLTSQTQIYTYLRLQILTSNIHKQAEKIYLIKYGLVALGSVTMFQLLKY